MALVKSLETSTNSDRFQQLKTFNESKAGVKGLVDFGVTHVPLIFLRPPEDLAAEAPISGDTRFTVPVVDLVGERDHVVSEVRRAVEKVGLFQVVNHEVAETAMEKMVVTARRFHEAAREVKEKYYTKEKGKKVKYGSNFDLYRSKFASWRDTLFCAMAPPPILPQELPLLCRARSRVRFPAGAIAEGEIVGAEARDITMEYSRQVQVLGGLLFALLSEVLGPKGDHLEGMDCSKGHSILMHYYPPCPQPHLTLGTNRHSDPDFLTLLLQDHIGGLQILH
ncbi:hypothetical protein Fmac_015838 [Flemingia macrophylla]|uniref:Uncharacterized protein n=1 Tax=Flemingia macrophylla TaxID=520843 RepID=A0ABD1MHT6_9FABA